MAGRKVLWGILLAGALGLYLFANSAGTLCVLLAAALPLLSAISLLVPRQISITLSAPKTSVFHLYTSSFLYVHKSQSRPTPFHRLFAQFYR